MLPGNIPEVFLDTDIAFDIISKRQPYFGDSVKILEMAAQNKVALMISGSSFSTLCYLSFDIYKIKDASSKLCDFIQSCALLSTGKMIALQALQSGFKDKEDAIQYFTAHHAGADYFVTRNVKDYKYALAQLPVLDVSGFINLVEK